MEGAGILTLCAMLLLLPFELWQAHAQKLRRLSPHEINLRRASQPLGIMTVLAWGGWQFGTHGIGRALAPVLLDPAANWLPVALLAAVLLYGLASFITGAGRCWGVRSDRMLPVRAFFKLATGIGVLVLLLRGDTRAWMPRDDFWAAQLSLALNLAASWCAAVGGARFVLLTVGGGSARRQMATVIATKNAPMIAVRRRRSWWKFW